MGKVCYKRSYPPRKPPNFQVLENMVFPRVVHGVETMKLKMVPLLAKLYRHFFGGKKYEAERGLTAGDTGFSEILALENCKY